MTKQNYLCIQRSQPRQPGKGEAPSPAQMEEMYAKFNAWRERFQENIVDMGGKLGAIGAGRIHGRQCIVPRYIEYYRHQEGADEIGQTTAEQVDGPGFALSQQ